MASHTPRLLTIQQRQELSCIPDSLSNRQIAHYYTLLPTDLQLISQQHGQSNRLGFAVQLCTLRFPGRALVDLPRVPEVVLAYIAEQISVPPEKFSEYGQRPATLTEHLLKIQTAAGYREYTFAVMLQLTRRVLPLAMEIDTRMVLVEA